MPTTDVLDRGKVYAELDTSFKPNDSIGNQNPQNGNHFFLMELGYNFD